MIKASRRHRIILLTLSRNGIYFVLFDKVKSVGQVNNSIHVSEQLMELAI